MYTKLKEFKAIIKPYNYTCNIRDNWVIILFKNIEIFYIKSRLISTKNKNWLINLTETILEISERRTFYNQKMPEKDLPSILEGELRKRKLKRLLK